MSHISPLLSAVVPVYNTKSYLGQCLDSLINQSLKDIEIIIVNDCSPDDSEAVINQYIAQDKRIRYIKHKSNLGVFSAIKFEDEGGCRWYAPYFDIQFTSPTGITSDNINGMASTAYNKIYKTEDVRSAGVLFPEHLRHEDEEFWLKYASKVKPLAVGDPQTYYQYRQRKDSITAGSSVSRKDMPQIFLNIGRFWQKEGLLESYKKSMFISFYCSYGWYINDLPPSYRPAFAKKMREAFPCFELSLEETLCINPQLIAFYIEDETLRQYVCGAIGDIRHDRWHRFGQFSRKQKTKKNITVLLKKFGLYPILAKYHRMGSKLK